MAIAKFKLEGFSPKTLSSDLSAGLVKSIDSVTGGMANAVLAGVNPVYGLYTVLAATPIGALFTSSVYMNIDSTGAISATAGAMLLAYPPEVRPQALAVLTLLTAAWMLAAGLLKLGFLTRFISNAVLRGFLTGIGINIILGQLGDFTGYASEYENKVVKAGDTLLHLGQIDLQVLLVGVVTVTLIMLLDRTRANKISLLIALVVASALVPLLSLTTVPLVASLGALPDTLPRPVLPDLTLIPGLIPPAFSLTIIALAQSAGISQAYVNPNGKYPNVSRDFIGQGAANVAGALFQGLPSGGSLSGTQMVVKAGAQSRWANILVGVFAAIIILVFGSFISKIAIAALAGLLMVVGYQTIKFGEIRKIWRTGRTPRALMLITLGATLFLPLQFAILFGVALSLAVFAYRESESTAIVEVVSTEGAPIEQPAPKILPSNKVTALNIYGNLFFAGARNLEEDLPQVEQTKNAVVILSLRGHLELGSTFIGVLERYAQALRVNGNTLLLSSISQKVFEQLEETQALNLLGKENVFVVSQPGESSIKAYERAKQLVHARAEQAQAENA